MPRKGENIRKRKDGRWEGRFAKGRSSDGKILYGYVYGKTYKEVREKKILALTNAVLFQQEIPQSDGIRFREVLSLWSQKNRIQKKGGTIVKYDYLIEKHILPDLGNYSMNALSPSVINQFLLRKLENGRIDKSGGLSSSYVRTLTIIIEAAIKYAVELNLCSICVGSITKPAISKKVPPILDINQQALLEQHALSDLTPSNAGILLSLHTGMRIGEVCALRWDEIDMDNRVIHVKHTIARVPDTENAGKTKLIVDTPKTPSSNRDIPISSKLFPILCRVKERSCSDYVISNTVSFTNPRSYEYMFHKATKFCSLSSINYHALRHTFATRCVEAGMDVKSLSEILGHASVSTTLDTYVHSSMQQKREQIEKIECGDFAL